MSLLLPKDFFFIHPTGGTLRGTAPGRVTRGAVVFTTTPDTERASGEVLTTDLGR